MDGAKGSQGKKEASNAFVLPAITPLDPVMEVLGLQPSVHSLQKPKKVHNIGSKTCLGIIHLS
jgi:hypothetical protein